jgi:Ras of Complex, Roc, domain of DAPkinase/Leucine rich repeat
LGLIANQLSQLPPEIIQLQNLTHLGLNANQLTTLPVEIAQLQHLVHLDLAYNPLNSELAAAYENGMETFLAYLRAQAEASITLNEAKLILVGEGKVGKSSLLGALRGDPWVEGRPTTHGIEIKSVHITHQNTEITLNAWDFGGQDVYRPTHQLFFSAPAIYLVVWKPREGKKQGFVKEWITLITRREPAAKILIVATHRAPGQRQPDIDKN